MSVVGPGRKRPRRRHSVAVALAGLLTAALGAASLVSCSSDSGNDNGSSASPTPTGPDTASFTGTAPSAVKSLKESVRASVSAAASSASAAASAFEASVSADVERANAAAQKQLADVEGRGNATSEVALTGMPRSQTGGLLVVVVNITNKTDKTASYAVQVDFRDPDGKVAETRYVGAQDLKPGDKAQPLAISRKPDQPQLTAEIAKAQRY